MARLLGRLRTSLSVRWLFRRTTLKFHRKSDLYYWTLFKPPLDF
jgi:hypothetical protein